VSAQARNPPGKIPRWAPALAIGIAAALAALLIRYWIAGAAFNRLEDASYDALIREHAVLHPCKDPSRVIIIAVDPDSEQALGKWPWPRKDHGRLIQELKRIGFKTVAFDILFDAPSRFGPADDQALFESADKAGNVVWQSMYPDEPGQPMALPIPLLRGARGSRIGFANVSEDDDQIVRGVPATRRSRVGTVAPFAVAVIEKYRDHPAIIALRDKELRAPGLNIPLSPRGDFPIRFAGPAYTVHHISYADVMGGGIPDNFYRGKIALVGRFDALDASDPNHNDAGSLLTEDRHRTPYTSRANLVDPMHSSGADPLRGEMYGIEIHAQTILALLDAILIRPGGPVLDALALLALSILVALVTARISPWLALLPTAVLLVVFIAGGIYLFLDCNLWLELNDLWLGAALSYAGVVIHRFTLESRERKRTFTMFSRYVAPEVARKLMEDPESSILGRGAAFDVTVLFCDIRNFTSRSEQLSPSEILTWLTEHLEAMVEVIKTEGGTVDKYVGDAIMAVFGAPTPMTDHAPRAVRAARAMMTALDRVNADRAAAGLWTYDIGIGLHSGMAIAGSIGHHDRREYAVMGDTVNTASRVESLNKEYGTRILISGETKAGAGVEADGASLVGETSVRGRQQPVALYDLEGQHTGPLSENPSSLPENVGTVTESLAEALPGALVEVRPGA
jgi:adenylate cyclase